MTNKPIWMLGTAPDGKGGIASVLQQYQEAGLFKGGSIHFESTHHDKHAWGRVLPFLRCACRLWPSAVRGRVKIIHAHTSYGGSFWRKLLLALPAFGLGVPVIVHLHAGSFVEFHANGSCWRKYWMRFFLRRAYRVVVLSDEWKQWVRGVEPTATTVVIANSLASETGAKAGGFDPQCPTVLFLGRVGEAKGTFDLLQAFAAVKAKIPAARLVIGGDGDIERLRANVSALRLDDSVEYVGWADSETKARLLAECWVFALPSYKEGLPMGILEAMAFSRAVVSCPVGGIAMAVEHGQTGFLVEPGDVAGLTAGLLKALSSRDCAASMGRAGRVAFERKFSHDANLPIILGMYGEAGVADLPVLAGEKNDLPLVSQAVPGGVSKMGMTFQRVSWLVRRLSRIYPAEIPYRIFGVLHSAAQARGWFDASKPPSRAADAAFGRSWVRVPLSRFVDSQSVIVAAELILTTGVRVFDINVPLANGIPAWNRDPKTGHDIGKMFGLSIDFRHIAGGVDIKYLWELNRHVWWVPLAQAYAVGGEQRFLKALSQLLDSWLVECPYPSGANWSSPVEHGIRLINWSIVWHLIGGAESPIFSTAEGKVLLRRWMDSVYQHMRFASDNYSFYSSSDNHLIGEAAGVFVAAHTWDLWTEARALRGRAKAILEEEMIKQFAADGVNLEQAICYHKFSLEFLLAAQFCGAANGDDFLPEFKARMLSAVEFMAAMMDCTGRVPPIGDSDDGKVFSFVGDGARSAYESLLRAGSALFGSPTLVGKLKRLGVEDFRERLWLACSNAPSKTDAAGAPAELPVRFDQGGYVLVGKDLHSAAELRITMDVGPLGYNRIAGHGHADALSVLLSCRGKDFLIDPGTYCYNAAPEFRRYFRGTSAHNTVVIDGTDQSIYGGSFLWLRDVATTVHQFSDDGETVIVEASHDGYLRLDDPVRHFRKLTFDRTASALLVEDRFECAKPHRCQLHWHFSPDCLVEGHDGEWAAMRELGSLSVQLESSNCRGSIVAGQASPPMGWVSQHFYERRPTQVLVVEGEIGPSASIRTRFVFSPATCG